MAENQGKKRDHDQETEVIPACRHDDAEWKVIQQNTFTRWVNNHLKKADDTIQNLETDFSDGLKLINLAMVLSQKNIGRFNKKVNFRSQKLENVSLALNFFENVEGIKIINIDSSHIVDKNKKLILGLIWTLILHYSISMGWIVEKRDGQPEDTPKQKLLNWVRGRLPGGMPLTNFTSDWNDGIALGALVNSLVPGAVPDWEKQHPANALENTEKAMDAAEEHLAVVPLITPSELIHPEIDEMSVMTYLSQFPAAKQISSPPKPLPAAPVEPTVSAQFTDLDKEPIVNQSSEFDVSIQGDGYKPKISIKDSSDKDVHHTITKKTPHCYSVKYTPSTVGSHKLGLALTDILSGEGVEVAQASVEVIPAARLCPYTDRVRIGEEVPFRVEDAFNGPVEMVVVDGEGGEHKLAVVDGTEPGVHTAAYKPSNKGLHSVNVFHRRNHIENSPFALRALQKTPDMLVWGRGLATDGVRVNDKALIHAQSLDEQDKLSADAFDVKLREKGTGKAVSVPFTSKDADRCTFEYSPEKEGDYAVEVSYDGEPVGESPYAVEVLPTTESAIRAFGPGLNGGIAKEQSVFEVQTNGQADRLAFSIEGPSKTEIQCQDRGNGAALVAYTPQESGVYKVNVLAGGEHIKDSPFVLMVDPADESFHPGAAQLTGLDPAATNVVMEPVTFKLDTRRTGTSIAPVVSVLDEKMVAVPLKIREAADGQYEAEFVPDHSGRYYVDANLRGVSVPGAPFTVNVKEPVDVSKLHIYGPGVDGPVTSREPTHFTIDAKQAGPGAVEVSLADRAGQEVDIDVLDHKDGSFTVKYTAPKPGAYELKVVFAGEEIPPIEINVRPHVDVAGISVEGLENGDVLIGHKYPIRVCTGEQVPQGKGLEVVANIDGTEYLVPVEETGKGVYEGSYVTSEPGEIQFKVLFDDVPLKEVGVSVLAGQDASKCKASGSGLNAAVVNDKTSFDICAQGAGDGALSVDITGPAEAPCTIHDNKDGTCSVDFVPSTPGQYKIDICYGDEKKPIPGSPFICEVDHPYEPSSVRVDGLGKPARVGHPIDFVVDASKTKLAPVTCRVPPVYQQPLMECDPSTRTYSGRFTPVGEPGDIVPVEVCYNDSPVQGSPFMLTLLPEVEPSNAKYTTQDGDKRLQTPASVDAVLVIDTADCGFVKSIKAEVTGPDGIGRECKLRPHEKEGMFVLSWPTDMAGKYSACVALNGIKGPVVEVEAVPTGRASDVVVPKSNVAKSNEAPPMFAVEKSSELVFQRDPTVNLSVVPKYAEAVEISFESEKLPNGKVRDLVRIQPTQLGANHVDFYYGGQKVHDLDYVAVPLSQLEEKKQGGAVSNEDVEKYEHQYENNSQPTETDSLFPREFKFNVDLNTVDINNLDVEITMPSKQKDHAQIIDNHDGTILVKYTPKTFGAHELSILQGGVQLQGTPVKFFVDSYGDGYATVYGPGLQYAVVSEPAAFTVCAKGSHAKELSVSIEGPAQSTIQIHDNKDGTCSVTWVPPVPGEYKVHVSLGKKEVRDSPFTVLVAGEGQKRSHLSVGSTSEVALNISESELKGISASIKSPSGIEEPCFIRIIEGGRLGVSFTPREAGEHLITVKRNGKLIPKAPFKIKVDKSQVGDASKVEVSGAGKANAICLQNNEILVDTTKAGYGGLSVSVQGPSKAELTCKEVKAGLIKVNYRPTEPGVYAIAIKFADHHVKDSPLTINCTGKGAGLIQQLITRKAEQAQVSLPDQEATLFLKLPDCSPMDIKARIMDPKGNNEDVEMRDQGEAYYQIKFRPKVDGVHSLSVMHRDAHINGSPFQFTVGSFGEGGAHKVRASGHGVLRGETNLPQSFNLYTREAGPGKLDVTVEGPSKAVVNFHDHKDGNCHVTYKVATPGEYVIAVKFNDVHIADSPFKVFVAAATGEARKLELAQFHDSMPTGKAFTFTVLTHRARGHLEAKVTTPNNQTETIDIVPIEEGESYALRFLPKETGNHYVHVTLDGAPMRDSPFRLRVGGEELSDPTAISASGEGLRGGVTGQKTEFIISTVNAGSGVLTAQVDGPSKVTLDAYELDLGYKIRFTPLAPGDYYTAVKYNGIHIPGSPFKIPISGKVLGGNGYNETSFVKLDACAKTSKGNVATVPEYTGDASKVVAKGAGLNKFFPGRPANFTIDTGLAGTNLLMVGVVTTRGPCEEVIVKHQGNGHYIVNYKVHDRVKGFVFVKYGDEEIPGSPFAIEP